MFKVNKLLGFSSLPFKYGNFARYDVGRPFEFVGISVENEGTQDCLNVTASSLGKEKEVQDAKICFCSLCVEYYKINKAHSKY